MANKLYNDTNIKDIADAIRAQNGKTEKYTVAEMAGAISSLPRKESVSWHQCPEAPRNFIKNVTYNSSDYSNSEIANYAPAAPVSSNTKPIGKTVGEVTYYNEVPNVETPFSANEVAGTLKPLDSLRWLKTETVNVRDLGGWVCDGGTVKYGMLFRGGEPEASDKNIMVNQVGVKYELNLRGDEVPNRDYSVWGIEYSQPAKQAWYSISDKVLWRQLLKTIINAVTHEIPLYFHCAAGADRTGTLACVLEAILGMEQSDIDKDYELTSFYSGTATDDTTRARNSNHWRGLINDIKAIQLPNGVAETFRNHAIYFVAECGITESEINAFRSAMVDGIPETITLNINNYTITKNATNITFDNTNTSVEQYQGYEVNFTPNAGYVISKISVTMGGADITAQYFSGAQTTLNRPVSFVLSNCSTTGKTWVIDGQSYIADLTADTGYTLEGATVKITMGGVDVSTYYSNGKIAIPNVTGDIVITATAVASYEPVVNLAEKYGVEANTRLSLSTGENKTQSGYCVVGNDNNHIIPYAAGDIFRIKGAEIPASDNNLCGMVLYNDFTGTFFGVYQISLSSVHSTWSITKESDDVVAIKFNQVHGSSVGIRFSLPCADTSNLIITKNQKII